MFARFSTVGGEKGSADTARDPRGFAVKFYTEEGNYDLPGNNRPVFFIRDPAKFPDFIHTQKRNPATNMPDPDMFWDFLSLTPESVHQVTVLFSDRGTPDGYRHMNGYSSHTFKWYNAKGEVYWVQYHFKTEQGIRNLTRQQAGKLAGEDPDYATRDLREAIAKGDYPSWRVCVQIMPAKDAETYRWNINASTKVRPHADYTLVENGRMTLNRNPDNYFASRAGGIQSGQLRAGIAASPPTRCSRHDWFSYHDAHLLSPGRQLINCCRSTRQRPVRPTTTSATATCAATTTAKAAPITGPTRWAGRPPIRAWPSRRSSWRAAPPGIRRS